MGDVQGGFQKCRNRETKRLEWLQAEVRGDWKQCREKGGLQLAGEPGKMQEQERNCKQGCSGSLGPYGCGPGPSIGLPSEEQGRMGPRQLPTGRKVLECRAEPLTYTLWKRKGRDKQTVGVEGGGKERQRSREDRQERVRGGQELVKLPLPTLPFLPACPRPPLTA